MIRAVIFDMDDVIINSTAIHLKAWDLALRKYKASLDRVDTETIKSTFGQRIEDIGDKLIAFFNLKVDRDTFLLERNKIFMGLISKELEPVAGLYRLLNTLRKRDMKLALATSGLNKYVNLVLDKLNLKSTFDAVIVGEDVEKGKPNPEVFLKAARRLGVPPKECLVIEDAVNGVAAAKAAGMRCIGYQNLTHPYRQDLSKADVIVKSLEEINLKTLERF